MSGHARVEEITPLELVTELEAGHPIQIVDVRAPARVAAGRIDTVPPDRFHNIVGSALRALTSLEGTGIDPAIPMAVVCGHGNDSRVVARHLSGLGAAARSLRGGMAAWMTLAIPRRLPGSPTLDRLVQLDRIGKGALGYVLVSDGSALVVDPPRDTTPYLAVAEQAGARIVGVADTHVHADYISGAPALARSLGVPYYLHSADAVYPYDGSPGRIAFHAVAHDDTIPVGRARMLVRHTPGHTEGSVTYVVDDVALTGDFLFVGSIGRPDLAGRTREWAAQLWNSVETARREWPLETKVYPAHYASDDERRPDRSVGATFGELLHGNPGLAIRERDAFHAWVEGSEAAFPDAYRKIKAVNVGLLDVSDAQADVLEIGRNECALGGR